MRQVIVMSGVSGSGKSTYVRNTLSYGPVLHATNRFAQWVDTPTTAIVSADDYFLEIGGEYSFRPSHIGSAHSVCFGIFLKLLQEGIQQVVVDNTNCNDYEIAPYMLAADALHYRSEIRTVGVDKDHIVYAAERNLHGVPEYAIQQQYKELSQRDLPPWWKHTWVKPYG